MATYDSAAARIMNENFFDEAGTSEGRTKLAAYGGEFIRDHLREESFCRKILNAKTIDPSDCQVSLTHDTLIRIEEIEPQSTAMSMGFRGEPTARYINAPRFAIGFFTISSEKFEKVEQELLAYRMPITKVIEDNSVKDIQEIEDREFVSHCESMVEFMQNDVNGAAAAFTSALVAAGATLGGLDIAAGLRGAKIKGQLALAAAPAIDFNVRPVLRPDFVNLFKVLIGKRLQPERVLLTEADWTDVLQWTVADMGDKIQSETVVDGYKYSMLLGMKCVRTIKNNILTDGNVYIFAAPEFFGYFYILNEVKFYIDKIANRIMWQSWEDVGMGFGNVSAVAKLELYPGSVTPTLESPGFGARVPAPEDQLAVTSNRVAAGGVFPTVFIF